MWVRFSPAAASIWWSKDNLSCWASPATLNEAVSLSHSGCESGLKGRSLYFILFFNSTFFPGCSFQQQSLKIPYLLWFLLGLGSTSLRFDWLCFPVLVLISCIDVSLMRVKDYSYFVGIKTKEYRLLLWVLLV